MASETNEIPEPIFEEVPDTSKIYEILAKVQQEIKCPKSQENKFGGYKYRSLEDINAAAKPICAKYGAFYTLTDELVVKDDRVYIKAYAGFNVGGASIAVSAYAREQESKKGMDEAQITGLASSYARKYALCGLFAIDSGEEVDALDNTAEKKPEQKQQKKPEQKQPAEQKEQNRRQLMLKRCAELITECVQNGVKAEGLEKYMTATFEKEQMSDLSDNELILYGTYLADIAKQSGENNEY